MTFIKKIRDIQLYMSLSDIDDSIKIKAIFLNLKSVDGIIYLFLSNIVKKYIALNPLKMIRPFYVKGFVHFLTDDVFGDGKNN